MTLRHVVMGILGCMFLVMGWLGSPGMALGLEIRDLPEKVELAGFGDTGTMADLLRKTPVLIVVGSHSTFPLLKELPFRWVARGWKIDPEQFVAVAAVGNAPWLVKKLLVTSSLRQIKEERDARGRGIIPNLERSQVIVDREGTLAGALGIAAPGNPLGKNGYAAYIVAPDGTISLLLQSSLPEKEESEIELIHAADAILDKAALSIKP
ncbi:MAG: hypothetical protein HQL76_01250 [Magnetococcales bacterium]|nr:hypothetical protein [Magnetococcales bacterium]